MISLLLNGGSIFNLIAPVFRIEPFESLLILFLDLHDCLQWRILQWKDPVESLFEYLK